MVERKLGEDDQELKYGGRTVSSAYKTLMPWEIEDELGLKFNLGAWLKAGRGVQESALKGAAVRAVSADYGRQKGSEPSVVLPSERKRSGR